MTASLGWIMNRRILNTARSLRGLTLPAAAFAIAVAAVAHAQTQPARELEQENRRCYNCHGQAHIAELGPTQRKAMVAPGTDVAGAAEERPELYVAPDALMAGPHARTTCVSCHTDARQLPHPARLAPASCTTQCHTSAAADFRRSVHAEAQAKHDPLAPACTTCHGGHDVLPASNPDSRTYPLNIVKVCADCHQQHHEVSANGHDQREFVQTFLESVHGKAVMSGKLSVAATCSDCHEHHAVMPSTDPASSVNRANVPETCGQCHRGVEQQYVKSIHGLELAAGNENAPVCSDCHTAHGITRASTEAFFLDIIAECGKCHDKPVREGGVTSLYKTYRRSYHGQVTQLGSTRAARCSDCHGAHDILPTSDPASRLHKDNRVQACAKCHPGATAKFAQFEAHADFRDGERFPLLHGIWLYFIIVMSATFAFFGLHSAMWYARSLIDRVRHGPHPRHKANPHGIQRFTTINRVNHALIIVSFFGLTLTGMPLLFSDQRWAQNLARWLGGAHSAGIIHRVFAVMLLGNFVLHMVFLVRGARQITWRKMLFGANSMLPRWKDVTDCLGMFRWFFRGGQKPRFDRWTYWEKFDYWAEIFGTSVIGGSGLMLWFPSFFANWLPGWVFNIATIIHGYEALLAVGFIFTIHFFNAHLRLEKFPVDDVMFTGQLPEEEFKHERPVEYERLVASGKLDELKVAPAPRWQRIVAVITGILAMTIGTIIVALIIIGGLKSL